jgi:phenylacetate-CoA ligase
MGSFLKNIKKQPLIIQRIFFRVIPFRWRYGKKFREQVQFLQDVESWSYQQTRQYQLRSLIKLLKHAYENVPYYRDLFNELKFNPEISDFEDLKKLPFLTKDLIRTNYDKLIDENYSGKKYKMNTSGSSGKRLDLVCNDELFKIEAAYIYDACKKHGVNLYDEHSIWLRRYSPSERDKFYRHDYELNRTYLSAFHLNDSTIHKYVSYINESKTKNLISYPSTLYYLALLCEKHGLNLPHVKNMHGASEMCFSNWREKIKEVFSIDIKMHYGQVEKSIFAYQDMDNDMYNESLTYSYNEFLEDGTVVGTGFHNTLMPLIRYRTEDRVKVNLDADLSGSHPKTIAEIEGRNGDMLIHETGALLPAVNFYSFLSKCNFIDMFQIRQDRKTKNLTFLAIKSTLFDEKSESYLKKELTDRLGNVKIDFIYKDELDRDANTNKFKTIQVI